MALKHWQGLFILAALFNFAAGLPPLLAPQLDLVGIGLSTEPANLLMVQTAGALITTFGIGYAMVAIDPLSHRGIVWLGMIGKALVVFLLAQAYLAGHIPADAAAIGLGDLLFIVVFGAFLLKVRPV